MNKKALAAMILGIASIALCESVIGGLVCAIIALVFTKQVRESGEPIEGKNSAFLKAAKITGTIGVIFSAISIMTWVVVACLWTGMLCASGVAAGSSVLSDTYVQDSISDALRSLN